MPPHFGRWRGPAARYITNADVQHPKERDQNHKVDGHARPRLFSPVRSTIYPLAEAGVARRSSPAWYGRRPPYSIASSGSTIRDGGIQRCARSARWSSNGAMRAKQCVRTNGESPLPTFGPRGSCGRVGAVAFQETEVTVALCHGMCAMDSLAALNAEELR